MPLNLTVYKHLRSLNSHFLRQYIHSLDDLGTTDATVFAHCLFSKKVLPL